MKNAALCEALPLLATCSHEIPPTPHTVCFVFPPALLLSPSKLTLLNSRRVASRCVIIIDPRLLRLFSCSRPQQLPRDKNQSFAKPSFLFLSSYLVIIAFLNFLGQAFQRCFFVLTSTANFHIFFPSCYI
nr:CBM_HP1_G0047180.mRNA.1.CDS.1 [Saccharomyces cerevisiae]